MQIVEEFNPQVVIVLDDNAIREVMLPLVNRNDLSIVFSGMNGQPAEYNRKTEFLNSLDSPGHNVTGVYEKLHLVKSLRVIAAAIGDIKEGDKVVGITDYSPTGNAITRQFEIELEQKTPKLEWDLRRVRNFEEYKSLINELNQDPKVRAIYPAALKLLTADGQTYTAGNIFKWTTQNSLKPEMALNYYFSKIGLFGGAAVDFTAMGYIAGKKAAQILGGTSAGQIPIEDASDYAIVFNLQRAKALDIEIPDALLTAADQVYKEETTK
ncbi:MAG: ABC transporter substrate binding protein [Candidatus Thiodiazotropha sp. L084R]